MKETLEKLINLTRKEQGVKPTGIGIPGNWWEEWLQENQPPLDPIFDGIEIYKNPDDRGMRPWVRIIF